MYIYMGNILPCVYIHICTYKYMCHIYHTENMYIHIYICTWSWRTSAGDVSSAMSNMPLMITIRNPLYIYTYMYI